MSHCPLIELPLSSYINYGGDLNKKIQLYASIHFSDIEYELQHKHCYSRFYNKVYPRVTSIRKLPMYIPIKRLIHLNAKANLTWIYTNQGDTVKLQPGLLTSKLRVGKI